MTFPDSRYARILPYADDYFERVAHAARSLDRSLLERAADTLDDAYRTGHTVFACGNGGSASISNHLACDHLKGIQTDTDLAPRATSLSANVELISAIANDIGYEDVFVYQLRTLARPGDCLMTISSSGDSENVARAMAWARENGLSTIALTGFEGGRTGALADIHLHVAGDNYGVVEDVHQSIMHVLAQYLRQRHMEPGRIAERKF
jgi:phosphoheptose isomerase